MDRILISLLVGGVQASVVCAALATTAARFDRTEMLAVALSWLALSALEWPRRGSGQPEAHVFPSRRAAVVSFIGMGVLATAAGWSAWRVGEALENAVPREVQARYIGLHGTEHVIRCTRRWNEDHEEQVSRLDALVRALKRRFPERNE